MRFRYGGRRVKRLAGMRKKDAEFYLAEITVRIKNGGAPFEEEPQEVSFKEFLAAQMLHVLENMDEPERNGYMLGEQELPLSPNIQAQMSVLLTTAQRPGLDRQLKPWQNTCTRAWACL